MSAHAAPAEARRAPVGRDLVHVARALFEPEAQAAVAPLLRAGREVEGLPRGARAALEDVLRKGLVLTLARGGARPSTSWDGRGGARAGRAWERLEPPALAVSRRSFELLRWLLQAPLGEPSAPRLPARGEPTLADELLLALAWELLDGAGLRAAAAAEEAFARSPLVWLVAADALAAGKRTPPSEAAIERWAKGTGADLLSCLAPWLGARWVEMERAKPTSAPSALAVGAAQEVLLDRLVGAALAAGRPDAATFLLVLGERLLPPEGERFDPSATPWARPFDPGDPLAVRVAARRASVASLRALGRLAAARDRARAVGFVDDGYDEAQALVRGLAAWDDGRFERAREIVRAAERLDLDAT